MKITLEEYEEIKKLVYGQEIKYLKKYVHMINPGLTICMTCPSSISTGIRLVKDELEKGGFSTNE
jgi:hypothetical protein